MWLVGSHAVHGRDTCGLPGCDFRTVLNKGARKNDGYVIKFLGRVEVVALIYKKAADER
jgi:hypothetical protein